MQARVKAPLHTRNQGQTVQMGELGHTEKWMDGIKCIISLLCDQQSLQELEILTVVTKTPYDSYSCKIPIFQCKIVMNTLLMEVDQFR